jgi:hypothetical protein
MWWVNLDLLVGNTDINCSPSDRRLSVRGPAIYTVRHQHCITCQGYVQVPKVTDVLQIGEGFLEAAATSAYIKTNHKTTPELLTSLSVNAILAPLEVRYRTEGSL